MHMKKEDAITQFSHGYVVYSKPMEHDDFPEGLRNKPYLNDYVVREIIGEGPYSPFASDRETIFPTIEAAEKEARHKREKDIENFKSHMLDPAHKAYKKRNNMAFSLLRSFGAAVSEDGKKYKKRFNSLGPLLDDVQKFIEQLEEENDRYQPELKTIPDEFTAPRVLNIGQTVYEVDLSANRFLDEGIEITAHTITERTVEYDDVNTHRSPYLLQVSYMLDNNRSGFTFNDDNADTTELTGNLYQHRYFTELETAQQVAREAAQEYLNSARRMIKKFTP